MELKFGVVGSGQRPEGMPDGSFFRSFAQQAESLGFESALDDRSHLFRQPNP